jgi:outer membrane protein OmpA-like peptidoglycan-associated protein
MEGPAHAAVFLNGKTPDFLVGHVDEFDSDLGWRGQLIVPPGNYQVNVIDGGTTVWSGAVTVAANQTVNIHAKQGGEATTSSWSRGEKLSNLWPFKSSLTTTTVVVAPVTEQFSANPAQVSCGASSRLNWTSTGAVTGQISELGDVPASGDREVQPKQTTTYKFTAAGPGGIRTSDATVTVNSAIQASLGVSPAEVRYHAVGDKVDQQASATVNWSAAGADSVSVDPFGSVGTSGNRTVQATPSKTTPGPVDETVTYTLRATNACGGTETRTASLHIVGSIEPSVNLSELESKFNNIDSVYFPTAQPTRTHPEGGLLPGEQGQLDALFAIFKQYLEARPETHLILEGHADRRGGIKYNQGLTERRDERVKRYLVEKSVPDANIETHAFGKTQNLTAKEVLELNEQNPNLTPKDRTRIRRRIMTYGLANNRRVDMKLGTTGAESRRYFPYNSDDAKKLLAGGTRGVKKAAKEKAPETK